MRQNLNDIGFGKYVLWIDMPQWIPVVIFCLVLHIGWIPLANARHIMVEELPTQHLLPSSPVHRLIQDREGYMWYATEGGGLCRDDGYQINVFRSPFPQFSSRFRIIGVDSMKSNHITCLAEDRNGSKIWFGTTRGLCFVDKTDYSVHIVSDERLSSSHINILFADHAGYIWVSANEKILRMDIRGKVEGEYTCSADGNKIKPIYFHEDSRHELRLLCTGKTLLKYDREADCFVVEETGFSHDPTSMSEDLQGGGFLVGTWGGGVVYYRPRDGVSGDMTTVIPQQSTTGSGFLAHGTQVLDVLNDESRGLVWVVTMDNLYVYGIKDGEMNAYRGTPFLPDGKKVLDLLFKDRSGNIWVPGFTPHTFVITEDADKVDRYPVAETGAITGYPLMADAVVKDGGSYWIWQGRDNLTLYDPEAGSLIYLRDMPYCFEVEKCIEKCSGVPGIWAAHGGSVFHLSYNGRTIVMEEVVELPSDGHVTALHEAYGHLWIGTGEYLYKMPLFGNSIHKVCATGGLVKDISADSSGAVYAAAGDKGFIHVSSSGDVKALNRGEDFTAVTLATDGTVWAATSRGSVYSYDPANGVLRSEDDSCLSGGESIKSLESDMAGHIWILADQYVKEYNPSNKAFRILRSTDKKIGMDYMHSVRRTDGDRVCVGGMGAFCVIPSSVELDHKSASEIKPSVTSVIYGDTLILPGYDTRVLRLPPEHGECKIAFSTLDHIHASGISYAYRLKGWQDEWIYLPQGNNIAYFSHLPKGSFRLELKATDRYGCWGETYDVMELHVLPAWYETWWAYIIYAVAAVSLSVGIIWLSRRIRQLLELHRRRGEVMLGGVDINVDETSLPKFDKDFLQKAVCHVESHLSDPRYNVEQLSSDLCMSRMNLYRRIQSQTGRTPTEFIRDIRLKKAAAMLENSDIAVKDVARMSGFSTPAYFSKCFKEMFGVLPTRYGKRGAVVDADTQREM